MQSERGKTFLRAPEESQPIQPEHLREQDARAIARLMNRPTGVGVREVETAAHADALAVARERVGAPEPTPETEVANVEMPRNLDPNEELTTELLEQIRMYLVQERDAEFSSADLAPYGHLKNVAELDEVESELIEAWNTYRTYKLNLGNSRTDAVSRGKLRALASRAHAAVTQREIVMASMASKPVRKQKLGLWAAAKRWFNEN